MLIYPRRPGEKQAAGSAVFCGPRDYTRGSKELRGSRNRGIGPQDAFAGRKGLPACSDPEEFTLTLKSHLYVTPMTEAKYPFKGTTGGPSWEEIICFQVKSQGC